MNYPAQAAGTQRELKADHGLKLGLKLEIG